MNLKNIINKRNGFRTLLGALIVTSSIGICKNLKKEKNEQISEETFHSICLLHERFNEQEEITPVHVTKSNLQLVEKFIVNAEECDFNDLQLLPNLKEITILNPEELTEEDKQNISKHSSLEKINLSLSALYANINQELDLSWVNKTVTIDKSPTLEMYNSDLIDLYIYSLYDKLDYKTKEYITLSCFTEERKEELNRWDKIIENIVNSFAFTEDTNDLDKIIEIISFVTDAIEYDPEVENILIKAEEEIFYDEKTIYYNKNLLKALFDSEENYGICCNYAALTSILGYYSDIDLRYTEGDYGTDINNKHAWCVYEGKEKNIIDPTFLDDTFSFQNLKESIKTINDEEKKEKYRKRLSKKILTTENESEYSLYKEDEKYWTREQEKGKNIEYINTNDNEYNIIQKSLLIYEIINSISLLLLAQNIAKEKTEEEQKCLIKK